MTTPGPGRPLRGDRIHRYVNAFCPICHEEAPERALADVRRLSGWLAERDGRIWLERGCPTHGQVRTLYDESPEILRYLEQWTAPTKSHVPDRPGNFRAIPEAYAFGLPAMQTQHTCILLEESWPPPLYSSKTASNPPLSPKSIRSHKGKNFSTSLRWNITASVV